MNLTRRRAIQLALTAGALLATEAACGKTNKGTDSGGTKNTTLVVENSFDLTTADPGRVYEVTGGMVAHAMYEPLLTFAGGDVSKPVPLLAKSFEASADGKVLTLKLDETAKFSDGSAVTADDVVFSFNRVKNVKGNPSFLLDGVTVTAPDAQTVVLTSAKANPALPYLLPTPALGIVNSKVAKAQGAVDAEGADKSDKAETWFNANSAGSGPYTLQSFSTTTEVVLVANDKYWGTKPVYTKIVLRNVTNSVQKLDVVKDASQLALDLSPDQAKDLGAAVTVDRASTTTTFFLFTNMNPAISPVTSNPKFQEAVRYGLDYAGIMSLAGEGAVQAPGLVPDKLLGALAAGDSLKRDLDRAKAALAASGYSGQEIPMEYPSDITKNGIDFGVLAQKVQAGLTEVGIKVKLAPAPVATALPNYRDGKEKLGLWLWGADYPDPSDYLAFLPGGLVGLRAGWKAGSSPDLTTIGDQAAIETDSGKRAALYQDLQRKLNEVGPFMPLFQSAQISVMAKSVSNFVYNAVWTVDFGALK
ncbi:peptide/nickel transport system substrate-binding protein [Actinoplanes tereljensis]|uniref:ABC transporter substrate-binding protein n=1 Tax=Paractinoplanes tereljensis TaxID=571912 RepID=A0A919TWG4_9ACTN|nr:ABC transporter substrate-binding protein [Actinoplanes tereljensis]GIF23255.1 ABC transporter substrate-binding protein [Actinoplanes tereljensis]